MRAGTGLAVALLLLIPGCTQQDPASVAGQPSGRVDVLQWVNGTLSLEASGDAGEWLVVSVPWQAATYYEGRYEVSMRADASSEGVLFFFPPTLVEDRPGEPPLAPSSPVLMPLAEGATSLDHSEASATLLQRGAHAGLVTLLGASSPWTVHLTLEVDEPITPDGAALSWRGQGMVAVPVPTEPDAPTDHVLSVELGAGWTHVQSVEGADRGRLREYDVRFADGSGYAGRGYQSPPPVGVQSDVDDYYGHPGNPSGTTSVRFRAIDAATTTGWFILHFPGAPDIPGLKNKYRENS